VGGEKRWRCIGCGKTLGVLYGRRLQVRLAKGHRYTCGLPVTCRCPNHHCRELNEITEADCEEEGRKPPSSAG
jgi:hypothetical protein